MAQHVRVHRGQPGTASRLRNEIVHGLTVPIDPAKDAPLTHRRHFEPAAQRPDRTRRFFSSDGDGRAGAFAVGLRAPDRQQAARPRTRNPDPRLPARRARYGAGPPSTHQQQRPIAQPPQIVWDVKDDGAQLLDLERDLLRLGTPSWRRVRRTTARTMSCVAGVAWSIDRW
jgi:hypothetical protein